MSSVKVTPILKNVCQTFGEGPHWDAASKCLHFVGLMDGAIHKWDSQTGKHSSVKLAKENETICFVIPDTAGGLILGHNNRVVRYNWSEDCSSEMQELYEVEAGEGTRFNDAKCDPEGNLLAGTMSLESGAGELIRFDAGSLYGFRKKDGVKKIDSGISLSNGLDWWTPEKKLFFIESISKQLFVYDWDQQNFNASNRQVAVDFKKFKKDTLGFPDGAAIDTNGNLWVACFKGSCVVNCDPRTGQLIREVDIPVPNVTSCCFGGEGLDEMFVTTSNTWGTDSPAPLGGSVFRVTGLGVKGFPGRSCTL